MKTCQARNRACEKTNAVFTNGYPMEYWFFDTFAKFVQMGLTSLENRV